jgi:phosphatidylethanolamine-binding protein (PEBP) family uncharacterized protein
MERPSLPWLLAAAALAGAAIAARAEDFSLRFSWAGIPACQAVSPAFELTGVPVGAKSLHFNMTDLDVPTFPHGGSTIPYKGDAVPRGAIKYVGPCPPRGERHRYRWMVQALDGSGKVMGAGSATATFPP